MDEILLEFIPMGTAVKVCAVHAPTGTEISIVGPSAAGQTALTRTAVRKLRYVLENRLHADGKRGRHVRAGISA